MKVIIAEKPSVAREIARVVRATNKKNGYIEGGGYAVTWALGHLITAAMPEAYGIKGFRKENLPILPPVFTLIPRQIKEGKGYKADAAAVAQLKVIEKLFRECEGIIVATDAGREGELIFRFIYEYLGIAKPFDRLWISSLTDKAIKEGLAHLQSGAAYDNLYYAARARSEADWLVGINGTRAMTAFNSRDGGFYLTTVGRVQTPTLAVVVEREEKIRRFVPRDYFEVKATFGAKAGQYEGKWFDRNFKKSDDPEHKADRFWTREDAEAIVAACEGKPGTVTEESKPSTQIAPALFDLTTLQREANGRFGFSAKTTLALAQALYEKHKVLTYPRTDSRALPEDYLGTVRQTLGQLGLQRQSAGVIGLQRQRLVHTGPCPLEVLHAVLQLGDGHVHGRVAGLRTERPLGQPAAPPAPGPAATLEQGKPGQGRTVTGIEPYGAAHEVRRSRRDGASSAEVDAVQGLSGSRASASRASWRASSMRPTSNRPSASLRCACGRSGKSAHRRPASSTTRSYCPISCSRAIRCRRPAQPAPSSSGCSGTPPRGACHRSLRAAM